MSEVNSNLLKTTSNSEILSIIEFYIQDQKLISFLSSEEVLNKLTLFLSYYTSGDKNDKIPERKLCGRYNLTEGFKNIINHLSSLLDLSKEKAYNLVNDFLEIDPKQADYFLYTESMSKMPNLNFKDKYEKFVTDYVEQIVKYYYGERLTLISIIINLFDYSFAQLDFDYTSLREFCQKKLLQEKKLFQVIWKQFVSYKEKPIRTSFSSNDKKDEQTIQIFKEQEKILDIINIICNNDDTITKELFEEMLDYFSKTNFQCYAYFAFNGINNDLISEIMLALAENLINKSILVTILQFQPEKIYAISKQPELYKEDMTPFNVSIDKIKPFFTDVINNQNKYPIQMTIAAMYKVMLNLRSNTAKNFVSSFESMHPNIREEETITFFIKMIQKYSDRAITGIYSNSYFEKSYKYNIKQWLNLIMSAYYDCNEDNYPFSLLELCSLVLNTPITRDQFFDSDKDNKTPIFLLFTNNLINPKNRTIFFINMCFALSVPKKNNEYNYSLLKTLCTPPSDDIEPFFYNVFSLWDSLNMNLIGKTPEFFINYDEQSANGVNINKEKIEFIRLFIRLYSYNYGNDETVILMQKDKEDNMVISGEETQVHYNTILKLTFQTMEILTKEKELYQRNSAMISEMYHLLINLFDKNNLSLANTLVDEKEKCDTLKDIIFYTMLNDHTLKEYDNTVLALKLIRSIFSFGNILQFLQTEKGKGFINDLFFFIKEAMNTFGRLNTFESIAEIKLIKEISLIINQLLSILTSSANRTPILIDNMTINPSIAFIINLLNSIEINEFLFNFLRLKVTVDQSQTSAKTRYSFSNMFLDKLIKKLYLDMNIVNNGFVLHHIKKMLREIMRCFVTMLDLLILFKSSKEQEILMAMKIIDIVKKWDYIFFTSKTMPICVSDTSNALCAYDINMIMLFFLYANFEEDNRLFYDSVNEDEDHITYEDVDMKKFIYGKFQSDAEVNIASLSYMILTRFVMLFNYGKENNVNVVNISNYLSIKKNSTREMEGIVSMFDKVKQTIMTQISKSDNFVKNEIFKFLAISASTQINFTSALLDDFSYPSVPTKTIWGTLRICIDDIDEKDTDIASICLCGYITMFLSQVLNNDMVYKKSIKELLSKNDNIQFFSTLLTYDLQWYQISNEILEQFKKNCDVIYTHQNSKTYFYELIELNNKINKIGFSLIAIKNISMIFSKLVTLTEIIHNKSKYDFAFSKELTLFIKNHLVSLISTYTCKMNNDFIFSFNNEIKNIFSSSQSALAIQIKQKDLSIQNEQISNAILLQNENCLFNYGSNYFIDLKDLYINIFNIKEYFDLFNDAFSAAISFNFSLSLFEAKTQAMFSASYLLSLLFTIDNNGYSMGSSYFTSIECYKAMNNKIGNSDYTSDIIDRHSHPKLSFVSMKEIFSDNISNVISYINDSILKRCVLDINSFSVDNTINSNMEKKPSMMNAMRSAISNAYCNYIALNYNIVNSAVDYAMYLLKANYDKNTMTLSPRELIPLMTSISNEISIFISKNDTDDANLILGMISLIYALLNYIILTKYTFEAKDIESLNAIMSKLNLCYIKRSEYRAVITYIFISYIRINFFIENNYANVMLNEVLNQDDSTENSNDIIKSILSKFNESTPQIEYQSFLMLLIELVAKYKEKSFDMIQNQKIFYYLKSKNNFKEIIEYVSNERTNIHFLWCWTLKLISTVIVTFSNMSSDDQLKYYSVYKNAVEHFKSNEDRVISMLSSCDYVDVNRNTSSKSLAFIEEIDMITEVIASIVVFETTNEFNDNDNVDFIFRICECILNKTICLFVPDMKYMKLYKSFSTLEKKMEEIHIDKSFKSLQNDMNINTDNKLILTSNFTYVNQSQSRLQSDFATNNNVISLFSYRIDQILSRSLFNISLTLKHIFSNDKYSYKQYIFDTYTDMNIASFDEITRKVSSLFVFAVNMMEKMIKGSKEISEMRNKSILFFNNINIGINTGFFNMVSSDISVEDMFKLNNYAIEYLMCVCVDVNDCVKYFNEKMYVSFDSQFKEMMMKGIQRLKGKLKERSDVCKIMKEYDLIMEGIVDGAKKELCVE